MMGKTVLFQFNAYQQSAHNFTGGDPTYEYPWPGGWDGTRGYSNESRLNRPTLGSNSKNFKVKRERFVETSLMG